MALYIGDIIDGNGNIMTKQKLVEELEIRCKFLQYQSVKAAIPNKWKQIIKENRGLVCFDTNLTNCAIKMGKTYQNLSEISTKQVYWHLVEKFSQRPTSEIKWSEKLPFVINEDMWSIIYTNDKYVTSDTYVQHLQYKITHRILACNKNLYT